MRHMPSPSHSSRFYHPHNIGWGTQIIYLLVMQPPPLPRYLVLPRSQQPQYQTKMATDYKERFFFAVNFFRSWPACGCGLHSCLQKTKSASFHIHYNIKAYYAWIGSNERRWTRWQAGFRRDADMDCAPLCYNAAGRSRDRIPVGGEIFRTCPDRPWGPTQPPVQWVPVLSLGVKSGRGVTLTPHPLLVPWSRKCRALPLLPQWAVRPVESQCLYEGSLYLFFISAPMPIKLAEDAPWCKEAYLFNWRCCHKIYDGISWQWKFGNRELHMISTLHISHRRAHLLQVLQYFQSGTQDDRVLFPRLTNNTIAKIILRFNKWLSSTENDGQNSTFEDSKSKRTSFFFSYIFVDRAS